MRWLNRHQTKKEAPQMKSRKMAARVVGAVSILALLVLLVLGLPSATIQADHVQITSGEGDLTFIQRIANSGATRLDGARTLAISQDGEHVYVVANASVGAITAFSRDSSTGKLTFINSIINSSSAQGLNGASDLVISPSGEYVYVVTGSGTSVITFSRDTDVGSSTFGALTYKSRLIVSGRSMQDLVVSADGEHGYGVGSRRIMHFLINASTGEFTFVKEFRPANDSNVHTNQLTISPDDQYIYVVDHNGSGNRMFSYSRNLDPEPRLC